MEGNFKEQIQLQVNLNLKVERGKRGRIVMGKKQARKVENTFLIEKVEENVA